MLRTCLIKFLLVLFLGTILQSNAISATVGHIVLSVGDVKRIDMEGRTAALRLGAQISEGDRIITGGDAIAIIVFVDEARISLRADSELLVKQYNIDPKGANTQLDFELVRGGIRQISGRAARLQPERYRLNTPIASIGVRGTDFLAKSSADALETFVHEGKIVLLSSLKACQGLAQTGNCAPLAHMSATDSARYLKIGNGGQIERRIVSTEEIEHLFGINFVKAIAATSETVASATPGKLQAAKSPDPAKPAEAHARPAVTAESFSQDLPTPIDAGTSTNTLPLAASTLLDLKTISSGQPTPTPTPTPTPEVIFTPVLPEVVASNPPAPVVPPSAPVAGPKLNNVPDLSRQLVWGRFSRADELPLSLWTPYAIASEGRGVTVGELGQYALWRSGPKQSMSSALKGDVQFDIHAGEAYFQQGGQQLAAQISNPALSINFDRATFKSSLTVSEAQTGSLTMQVSGKMNDEGVFVGTSPGQRVAGAVSLHGREAGFLFSGDYSSGAFKGITLWNAR